jgi:peptide-methionine (S)-S-oxide reductase
MAMPRAPGAAEDHHQQYLAENPFGYRCHANTGVPFPSDA